MDCQRKIKFYLEEYKSSKTSILKKYNKTRHDSKNGQMSKKINKKREKEESHNAISSSYKIKLQNLRLPGRTVPRKP